MSVTPSPGSSQAAQEPHQSGQGETDRELARLSAIIKQSQATAVVAAAPSLRLDCVVAGQLELCHHPRKALDTEPAVPMVNISLGKAQYED